MKDQFILWFFYKKNLEMYFMNNNANTSGNSPSGQSGTNDNVNDDELGLSVIKNFFALNEYMRDEIKKLRAENEKLKSDNRTLEAKYEGASNALQKALQKIKNSRQVSVEQNNGFSLLDKIKSFKDNLQSHRAVDYSCINNNKNQQTK